MRQEVIETQNLQDSCTIVIEYDDSIRSIDLEHFISSLRMIYQNELAVRTGGKTRDFTDVVRIQSIEKGSIVINLLFDWIPPLNLDILQHHYYIDLTDEVIELIEAYAKDELPTDYLKLYFGRIVTSIKNFKNILFKYKHKTTNIFFKDGNLKIIRNNENV